MAQESPTRFSGDGFAAPITVYDQAAGTPFVISGAGALTLGKSGGSLGFFGTTPDVKPTVPLTTPSAQDIIDALLLLGLIEQSD